MKSFRSLARVASTIAVIAVSPALAVGVGPAQAVDSSRLVVRPAHSAVHAFPFSLGAATGIDYSASRTDLPPPLSIRSFMASFVAGSPAPGALGSFTPGFSPNSFFLGSMAPIAYQIGVSGLAFRSSGVDDYGRLLRVTAPVAPIPQPETWAMLLVGIALVGLRLRRKIRLDNTRHFA